MSKTLSDPLKTFEDEIFEALDKPADEWRRAINETRTRLESLWTAAPTAELAFAIGYCWFHMPGHDQQDFEDARAWLLRAVALDPDHAFAAYYLACLFFEYQHWGESEHWLRSIPSGWFESRGLAWRERKREEMLVCVNLMTNAARVTAEDIRQVMVIHHDDPSVEVWPLPSELIETFLRLRDIDLVSFQRLAPVLAKELRDSDLADVYPAEIIELRRTT